MKLILRTRPYRYESLANYIKRLSDLNSCPSEWILSELEIEDKEYGKINCNSKENTFAHLKNLADITYQEANGMIANQFNYRLWDIKRWNSRNSIGRDISDYFDDKHTKYCPICLKQQRYHRIHWELKHINICLEHEAILISKCEKCGKTIDVESIVDGFCSCGYCLENTKPEKVTESWILENQTCLYYTYGLGMHIDSNEDVRIYNTYQVELKKQNFLYLYSFLYECIHDNLSSFKELNKTYCYDDKEKFKYSNDIIATSYIDSIFKKWPNGLYRFLEDMYTAIEIKYKSDYRKYTEYIQNPSLAICDFKEEIKYIDDFASITKLIEDFYKSLDTIDNYKYRLRGEIIENSYLKEDVPSNIIGLKTDYIRELFRTYSGDEVANILGIKHLFYKGHARLVRIEELVDFINKIIQSAKKLPGINEGKYKYNGFISIEELRKLFINFEIDYSEIFRYILVGKLKIYKDKFEICKTTNIFVYKDEAYKVLLERALELVNDYPKIEG